MKFEINECVPHIKYTHEKIEEIVRTFDSTKFIKSWEENYGEITEIMMRNFTEREHVLPAKKVQVLSSQGNGRLVVLAESEHLHDAPSHADFYLGEGEFEIVVRPRNYKPSVTDEELVLLLDSAQACLDDLGHEHCENRDNRERVFELLKRLGR